MPVNETNNNIRFIRISYYYNVDFKLLFFKKFK